MKNASPTAKGKIAIGVQPMAFKGGSEKNGSRSYNFPPKLGTLGNRKLSPFRISIAAATINPTHIIRFLKIPDVPPPIVSSRGN